MHTPPSAFGKKPRALFLSPEAPYPACGGGPLRSASALEYLARRYSVHAIVFREATAPDPAGAMPASLVDKLDVLDLPYHSKTSAARVLRNASRLARDRPPLIDRYSGFEAAISALVAGQQYEAAVIEHFWCAPYVEQIRPHARRTILDLHNIESAWHRSQAAAESRPRAWALRRFAKAAAALERMWLPKFDALLVASNQDADLVRALVPDAIPTVYPNALPSIALPLRQERCQIAFSGNLEYQPNISAIQFFHETIWPSLRSWPELKWKIIGKNPEAVRRVTGADPRIEVTGFVEDAVQALASAQVAVVPVISGSGTRVKILEAWAAGTPVVSTTIGAQGLDCHHQEHLLIADTPRDFTAAVRQLLGSAEDRQRIGAAGRRLYEERYTWPSAWKSLDLIFGNDRSVGAV